MLGAFPLLNRLGLTAISSGTVSISLTLGPIDADATGTLAVVTLPDGYVWPADAQTVTLDPISLSGTLTRVTDTTATLTSAGWQAALAALLVGETFPLTIRDAVALKDSIEKPLVIRITASGATTLAAVGHFGPEAGQIVDGEDAPITGALDLGQIINLSAGAAGDVPYVTTRAGVEATTGGDLVPTGEGDYTVFTVEDAHPAGTGNVIASGGFLDRDTVRFVVGSTTVDVDVSADGAQGFQLGGGFSEDGSTFLMRVVGEFIYEQAVSLWGLGPELQTASTDDLTISPWSSVGTFDISGNEIDFTANNDRVTNSLIDNWQVGEVYLFEVDIEHVSGATAIGVDAEIVNVWNINLTSSQRDTYSFLHTVGSQTSRPFAVRATAEQSIRVHSISVKKVTSATNGLARPRTSTLLGGDLRQQNETQGYANVNGLGVVTTADRDIVRIYGVDSATEANRRGVGITKSTLAAGSGGLTGLTTLMNNQCAPIVDGINEVSVGGETFSFNESADSIGTFAYGPNHAWTTGTTVVSGFSIARVTNASFEDGTSSDKIANGAMLIDGSALDYTGGTLNHGFHSITTGQGTSVYADSLDAHPDRGNVTIGLGETLIVAKSRTDRPFTRYGMDDLFLLTKLESSPESDSLPPAPGDVRIANSTYTFTKASDLNLTNLPEDINETSLTETVPTYSAAKALVNLGWSGLYPGAHDTQGIDPRVGSTDTNRYWARSIEGFCEAICRLMVRTTGETEAEVRALAAEIAAWCSIHEGVVRNWSAQGGVGKIGNGGGHEVLLDTLTCLLAWLTERTDHVASAALARFWSKGQFAFSDLEHTITPPWYEVGNSDGERPRDPITTVGTPIFGDVTRRTNAAAWAQGVNTAYAGFSSFAAATVACLAVLSEDFRVLLDAEPLVAWGLEEADRLNNNVSIASDDEVSVPAWCRELFGVVLDTIPDVAPLRDAVVEQDGAGGAVFSIKGLVPGGAGYATGIEYQVDGGGWQTLNTLTTSVQRHGYTGFADVLRFSGPAFDEENSIVYRVAGNGPASSTNVLAYAYDYERVDVTPRYHIPGLTAGTTHTIDLRAKIGTSVSDAVTRTVTTIS